MLSFPELAEKLVHKRFPSSYAIKLGSIITSSIKLTTFWSAMSARILLSHSLTHL
jgi:hypothetical protein